MTNINMNGPPYGAPGVTPYTNGHSMPLPPSTQSNGAAIPSMNAPPYGAPAPQYSHGANGHTMPLPQHVQSNGAYNGHQPPPAPAYAPIYSQHPASIPPPEMPQMAPAPNGYTALAPGTVAESEEPPPRCLIENGRKFELCVMQQPVRARMCGFGDKDRRPITPPPCIRLKVTDVATGKEVDCNDIDHGMYVVLVDLWSADGSREVNMVRHSATSPSISNTMPVSYQQVAASNVVFSSVLPQAGVLKFEPAPSAHPSSYNPYPGPPQVNAYPSTSSQGQQPHYPNNYAPPTNGSQAYPQQNGYSQQPPQHGYSQPPQQSGYYGGGGPSSTVEYPPAPQLPSHQYEQAAPQGYNAPEPTPQHGSISNASPQGMYTRNLIGSLSVSAFRLTDPDDRIGIWFVLQDLSVRTEGNFRLRFSYVNIGLPVLPNGQGGPHMSSMSVNTGTVPVLASCFSKPFQVFSAKRFPGVVESTALSKCFATQGIKIAIRKDGQGKSDKDKDFEED